ncbi:Synaptogyrin-3 [Pitangus sulphuratus]|nr:Synaptogyrin-3 [Pitangus sulphuratus]
MVVMMMMVMMIFSIVVFGSIVNECYVNKDSQNPELLCIFNENESACSYGIAVGIIAFFGCIFFFVVDLYFQQISSVKDRKRAVLLDLGFSGGTLSHPALSSGAAVVLAVRALQRYRLGTDMSLFATDQFPADPSAPYPGYPVGSGTESTETYQSPPFTETLEANPKGYQVPAY